MPRTGSAYPFAIAKAGSEEPKWRVLYNSIKHAVLDGRLAAGTRVPATRELARDFGVARGTVAQAYELLLAEGFLRGEIGRGTFIAKDIDVTQRGSAGLKRKHKLLLSRRGTTMASSPYPLAAVVTNPVPFAPFLPALAEFPLATWQRLSISSARHMTIGNMRDDDAQGYRPLRESLKHYLRVARGVRCQADNIFIFSSTMQALDACLRIFADEGDFVACEDPCYRGASALFRANRLKVLPIPVDENGMDVSVLVARETGVRLTYVTPAHQAPLGSVMSASRRLRLIEWAKSSSSVVFEDDYDGEYRYSGHPIPALQAHDDASVVIHSGSFSKTLFPALRLAYLVVPDAYVDALSAARSMTSRYAGVSDQRTLARFIAEGHFARHLGKMRRLYAERRNALNQLFTKYIQGAARLSPVEAGLQTACEFMIEGSERDILMQMRKAQLDIRGIDDYRINIRLGAMCVLGFAAFNPTELKQGVITMANVIDHYSANRKS